MDIHFRECVFKIVMYFRTDSFNPNLILVLYVYSFLTSLLKTEITNCLSQDFSCCEETP